jgi:hypothetical protein
MREGWGNITERKGRMIRSEKDDRREGRGARGLRWESNI